MIKEDKATIDVHNHPLPEFLRDALIDAKRSPSLSGFPAWSPELALETMTRFKIAKAILSVSTPGVHFGNDHEARTLARRFNEYCAGLRIAHPNCFGAFAALPLPDVEGACRELSYAIDELGLEGVGLLASYGTEFIGNAMFEPLMAELNSRDAIVFVHPAGHPSSRELSLDYPLWMLEYPIDTTRAAINLIMTGTTSRFPRIRFILAHNGGTLPFLVWRLCAAPIIDKRYVNLDPDVIRAEIRKFYYEIAQSPGNEAFGSLLTIADKNRILFGTDWPYCSHAVIERLESSFSSVKMISTETRQAIRSDNARRIFAT